MTDLSDKSLPHVRIVGGSLREEMTGDSGGSVAFLWHLGLDVLIHDSGQVTEPAVERNYSLRVLAQERPVSRVFPDPMNSKWLDGAESPADKKPMWFRAPLLMALDGKVKSEAGQSNFHFGKLRRPGVIVTDDIAKSVILTPYRSEGAETWWPSQPVKGGDRRGDIRLPTLQMVAGQIGAKILLHESEELKDLLGYEDGRVFKTLKLLGHKDGELRIWLTPRGIEFDVEIPDPTGDLIEQGTSTDIAARVRLEALDEGKNYLLRLIGPASIWKNQDPTAFFHDIDEAFTLGFETLRKSECPVHVDYDARSEIPPISWPLDWNLFKNSLSFGRRSDGAGNWTHWTANLGDSAFRARLITDERDLRGEKTVARLQEKDVRPGLSKGAHFL